MRNAPAKVMLLMLFVLAAFLATTTGCLLGDEDSDSNSAPTCNCPQCVPDANCPDGQCPDQNCPDGNCPCPRPKPCPNCPNASVAREDQFAVKTGQLKCFQCGRPMVGSEIGWQGQQSCAICRQCCATNRAGSAK